MHAAQVVAWGLNNYGQTNVPPGLTNVVNIAAGQAHSLALRSDGTLLAWGRNDSGQTNIPVRLSNVVSIACGSDHNLALRSDGTVVAWGANPAGQTDVPAALSNVVAIAGGGGWRSLALTADARVVGWGSMSAPAELTNVTAMAVGLWHNLALKSDGSVVAWGMGDHGNDPPAGLSDVVAIAAGYNHSLALKLDGTVVVWGNTNYSQFGQTNVPAGLTDVMAVAAGPTHSLAMKSDGSVVAWEDNSYGQTNVPPGLGQVTAIAAGYAYNLALVGDGLPFIRTRFPDLRVLAGSVLRVEATGAWPLYYQWRRDGIEIPGATNAHLALTNFGGTQVGAYTVLVSNRFGTAVSLPAQVLEVIPLRIMAQPTDQTAYLGQTVSFAVGFQSLLPTSCQWLRNGDVLPGETNATLALTNVTLTSGGSYSVVVSDAAGSVTSLPAQLDVRALLITSQPDDQEVFSGQSASFTVGIGSASPLTYQWLFNGSPLPGQTNSVLNLSEVTPALAGLYSVVASNGVGSVTSREARLTVNQLAVWGDNSREQTNVPQGLTDVVAIAAGGYGCLALRSNGTLSAWGQITLVNPPTGVAGVAAGMGDALAIKADGSLVSLIGLPIPGNLPPVAKVAVGDLHCLALTMDGEVRGWDDYGQTLTGPQAVPVGLGSVVDIATGWEHAVALRANGTVAAWGWSSDKPGLTNVPAGLSNVVSIAAAGFHSLALTADGRVVVWGQQWSSSLPPSGPPSGANDFVGIAASEWVSLGLKADGTIEIWKNWDSDWALQVDLTPSNLRNVVQVASGVDHSLALMGYGPPFVRSRFARHQVPDGGSTFLRVEASGSGPMHYQWRLNDVDVPGATNSLLILTNLTTAQVGNYTVVVSNHLGLATSPAAVVDVVPLLITAPPQARSALVGVPVTLEVTCESTLPLSYQWRRNGIDISGATNRTLTFNPASLGDTGTYTVFISNSLGGAVSAKAVLTVLPLAAWDAPVVPGTGNEYGQCDIPLGLSNVVTAAAGAMHSVALQADGRVVAWGDNTWRQTNTPADLQNVVGIAAGGFHTLALRADGTVAAWGENHDGQCNVPQGLTNVVKLAAGGWHSLALKADGTVATWGYGGFGLTNLPGGLSNVISVAAGGAHSVALKADGSVVAWGWNEYGQTQPPRDNTEMVEVAAGYGQNLALRADGRVFAWGAPMWVPLDTRLSAASAIAVGGYQPPTPTVDGHGLVVGNDGRVTGWWADTSGRAGGPDYQLPAWLEGVGGVACGWRHALAVPHVGSPFLLSQPTDRTVGGPLDTTFFRAEAHGQPPLRYHWRHNGVDIPGATNALLRLTGITPAQAGSYSVVVSNDQGIAVSRAALLSLAQTPLQLALDNSLAPPTTGGSSPWFFQTAQTHDGIDAAQSGAVPHGQESWLEQTVVGPGTLSFWWKVSSESDYDFLEFHIDGTLQPGRISGNTLWQRRQQRISAGDHSLRWRYIKDPSDSAGADAGWLDQVIFVPDVTITARGAAWNASGPAFELMVEADPNRAYWLEYATNLPTTTWQFVTGQTNVTGVLILSDPAPTNRQRFYRVGTAPAF